MAVSELDNPFFWSLRTRHRELALGDALIARYPPDYAPFLGVADAGVNAEDKLASLLLPDETVLLLGVAPSLSDTWQLQPLETLAQMVCDAPITVIDGPDIIPLDQRHHPDVLALVALVYPHYFRPRAIELGRYFGIYQGGRLAAMIGERLGTETHTEMSAICTHPDFVGRGYARRLTAFLGNDSLAQRRTPFLHVSYANTRAKAMYERMGYRLRRDIPFWSLQRR